MCVSISLLSGTALDTAPTSHHHQHNHSKEDDFIADCICCPCNVLFYVFLSIEEFLYCCCLDLLTCFGGDDKYHPGRRNSLDSIGCEYNYLPSNPGSSPHALLHSKSAPPYGFPPPRLSRLTRSSSSRYPIGFLRNRAALLGM
jgi:hypothetical protein